jgi:hypothetical protein
LSSCQNGPRAELGREHLFVEGEGNKGPAKIDPQARTAAGQLPTRRTPC